MSLCPHGININNRDCERCQEVAEAEHRISEATSRYNRTFGARTKTLAQERRERALFLISRLKGLAAVPHAGARILEVADELETLI